MAVHSGLHLGYIVDQHASPAQLQAFLASNPANEKAVIFRHIPLPVNMTAIDAVLRANPPKYLIFDETKSRRLRPTLSWHSGHVMLVDGFEKQERNSEYPALSNFESNVGTWRADGLVGMGDYLINGDHFSEGGGQPKVVTLHLAGAHATGLVMHHFSSTVNAGIQGAPAPKFAQACNTLVSSPSVAAMPLSSGIAMFQKWDTASHYPGLGSPKQASMQHHMELLARLV
ncbi:sce7725 family protein [Hymenobacter lapidarius]|uniref:sce7725 family protein n=1 Tax=Hymenobacter lapidarius TaxID=1908237 RepID=UPI0029372079|nr:sce7725 family protein [Hymenobacter lapidarius]